MLALGSFGASRSYYVQSKRKLSLSHKGNYTMPANIYDQHRAAFANVSAYVILNGAKERVASVAFKYPRDGAGRLYCYFHIFGTAMVRGYAGGCGYDKHSAAAHSAVMRVSRKDLSRYPETLATIEAMQKAIQDSGYDWSRELENAGFTVLQAV